jgi:hypothetical protein
MTTTTPYVAGSSSDHELARRMTIPAGIVSTLGAVTLSMVGANSNGERVMELAWLLVGGAIIFGLVVPRGLRRESAAGAALVMALLGALLVVPAFWSGWPVQLGAGAVLLGYAGKRAEKGSGRSMAALVVGTLVVIAYVAIYASDFMASA